METPFRENERSEGLAHPVGNDLRMVRTSRPGRTITVRKRCSIAHAVWYEPGPSSFCIVNAHTPPGSARMCQPAANYTVNGVRVS